MEERTKVKEIKNTFKDYLVGSRTTEERKGEAESWIGREGARDEGGQRRRRRRRRKRINRCGVAPNTPHPDALPTR